MVHLYKQKTLMSTIASSNLKPFKPFQLRRNVRSSFTPIQYSGTFNHLLNKVDDRHMSGIHVTQAENRGLFNDPGGLWKQQNPDEFPEPTENPLDKLPEAERASIVVDGNEWSYLRTKDGAADKPTIVCLHGILSSSYSYKETMKIFQRDGYDAVAVDWLGFGQSDKPAGFDYTPGGYTQALTKFLDELSLNKPIILCTQGYILGQYGVLWATENPERIEKLVILNTPLGMKSKLVDPLGSYKGFLKGFAFGKQPDAGMFHAGGGPYAFNFTDYKNLNGPYQENEDARVAFEAIMEELDWNKLLTRVSIAYEGFRKPAVITWGTDDKYLELDSVLEWLETKPTTTKLFGFPATMGHFPQIDYPEQLVETIERFINDQDLKEPSEVAGSLPSAGGPDF